MERYSLCLRSVSGSQAFPRPYWSNTSSNSIVRDLIEHADASAKEEELSVLLQRSISFLGSREASYHGFLLGVSYPPVILELRVSDTFKDMDNSCDEALKRIEDMKYDAWLLDEDCPGVWNYGIAFFRKQCRIKASFKKFLFLLILRTF